MPERKIKTEIPDEVESKKTPTPKAPAQNLSAPETEQKKKSFSRSACFTEKDSHRQTAVSRGLRLYDLLGREAKLLREPAVFG